MAILDDILINGLQSSSSKTPTIAGLSPIFIWSFTSNQEISDQASYEIRIGTSSSSWGANDFSGNVVSDTAHSSSNTYEYDGNNLQRGVRYYGQLQIISSHNESTEWYMFSFRTNYIPFITDFHLAPSSPRATDNVDLLYTFFDGDGHDESGTQIRWFRNNLPYNKYNNLCTLPSSAISTGDSWTAKIIPSDGIEFGAMVETEAITVAEAEVNINSVKIFPFDANVDDILRVEYDIEEDEYATQIGTAIIEWYVNNVVVENSNQQYVRLTLNPGDTVAAKVKLVDGDVILKEVRSGDVNISDVKWHIFGVTVNGLQDASNIIDTTPMLEWQTYKSTAEAQVAPTYYRVVITKTPAINGAVYDTGVIAYKKNSHQIPDGSLSRGNKYFLHLAVSDELDIDDADYITTELTMAGSSWYENVNNSIGWTIEFKLGLGSQSQAENQVESVTLLNVITPEPFTREFTPASASGPITITVEASLTDSRPTFSIVSNNETVLNVPMTSVSSNIATGTFTPTNQNVLVISGAEGSASTSSTYHIQIIQQLSDVSTEANNDSNMGLYIHDGEYFRVVSIGLRHIKMLSGEVSTYTLPKKYPDFRLARTFTISGKGKDTKIYIDNNIVLDIVGTATNESKLKMIEYGDIDAKLTNTGTFQFFRFSTIGANGFADSLFNNNIFYFTPIGNIPGGNIQYVYDNIVSWLPDDTDESGKLYKFNENSQTIRVATVTKNYSPITSIYIDDNRNKYIGTANGVTVIYGEKHNPDYELDTNTNTSIPADDFDRISTVHSDLIPDVEERIKSGWFSIDTTYRKAGVTEIVAGDEYDPYSINRTSHAIHYYSQRTHGHAWYDKADNEQGWTVSFAFDLDFLEADDLDNDGLSKSGFGVYINDGVRQEIIYFYDDRIRLFYANVFIPLITTVERDYVIVGKQNNIKIYQKLRNSPVGSHQLVMDGSGLFVSPASRGGNSTKPKVVLDNLGIHHAVWQDDGNGRSQIFYSNFDGSTWSNPEIITNDTLTFLRDTQFSIRNPDVDVDSQGRIWVAYEDTSWGQTEISVSVRDKAGWNPRTRITNFRSDKGKPCIKVDNLDNVHIVWEDNRDGLWKILWCQWDSDKQTWLSSGQFGSDTVVMQGSGILDPYIDTDPYTDMSAINFRNPKISFLNPFLWLVTEAQIVNTNQSHIYLSFRNTNTKQWNSLGAAITNSDNEVIGFGGATMLSGLYRTAKNPSIATSSSAFSIVVVWEDHTDPVAQIWGCALSVAGVIFNEATQITNQTNHCLNPCAGFAANQCMILFDKNGSINLCSYNTAFRDFFGSNTGGTDRVIQLASNKKASHGCMSNSPTKTVKILYSFLTDRDVNIISSIESPDYYLIGDATVEHGEIASGSSTTITNTLSENIVSLSDTKEFAFGDISENVGLRAHWKDIKMYFGYDARPHSIAKFNAGTSENWVDNRVNDLFVDVFGNVVAATFGGLLYHNVFTAKTTIVEGHTFDFDNSKSCQDVGNNGKCLLLSKLITSVKWGKNGVWYVGTTQGVFYSNTAGRVWLPMFSNEMADKTINAISIDSKGQAIIAAVKIDAGKAVESSVFVAHPSLASPVKIVLPVANLKTIAVDDNNVIWVGSDIGLFRIDNYTNIMKFDINQGLRSSHINGIAIVNKHLRYIATATGIERMNGMKFTNIGTNSALTNDNVSAITWSSTTNSLWFGSMFKLHEIVFRDKSHDIIQDEVTHYDTTEISTKESYDRNVYYILDFDKLQSDVDSPVETTQESTKVFVNKNKVDFGYTIDKFAQTILFSTNMLINDKVEAEISNKFIQFHDFNQLAIEQQVRGHLRSSISKMDRTSKNQLLLLSGSDKPALLLFAEQQSNLPFTTMLLDMDLPQGCLEKLANLTRTKIKFRITASDATSGLDGYILSNYENFTSDGTTPLPYKAMQSTVDHDIGDGINTTFDSLIFESTATINGQNISVGSGSVLTKWLDETTNTAYLIAGTSNPAVLWKYDPDTSEWTVIQSLDSNDNDRSINEIKTINNVIWVATGTSNTNKNGGLYKSVNGVDYDLITSVPGRHVRGVAGANDGSVYFGTSNGAVYAYKNNIVETKYENIGEEIYSLDIHNNIMVVATGNHGRVYTVNLDTDDNLIVFDGSEPVINKCHIKDSVLVSSSADAQLFVSSNSSTTIYRSNMDDFDFDKSYNSFSNNINQIKTVNTSVLFDQNEDISKLASTTTVASIGQNLFKYAESSWEFVYKHDEEIKDFIQYSSSGQDGIWIISDSKITKWTAEFTKKTVFLKLKDKAGNTSSLPLVGDEYICPNTSQSVCCNYAYSINIEDLKNFIHEGRIVDISEYGEIVFSYDSINDRSFFSAEKIDDEIGVYTSEIFNGSNDLVSWQSITWASVEPDGTDVNVQIRSGPTESEVEKSEWSTNLIKNSTTGLVEINHITAQYLQFRVILSSQVRGLSPSLSLVTIRNLTSQSSHFFTTNFILPGRPIKGLLTANTFIPVSADVVFGVNTNDSVDFGDYQIIEPNRLFTTANGQFGNNLRIGAKLLSPGLFLLNSEDSADPYDPYASNTFVCDISFSYQNNGANTHDYDFRIRFYADSFRTQLIHTFYSGNDATGWSVDGDGLNVFPSTGLEIEPNQSKLVTFTPDTLVEQTQRWYLIVDSYDGTSFTTLDDTSTFVCNACNIVNEPGIIAEYYYDRPGEPALGFLSAIPTFADFTPGLVTVENNVNFGPFATQQTNTTWITTTGTNTGLRQRFAIRMRGKLKVPLTGEYTFRLIADDGAILYINRSTVVEKTDAPSVVASIDKTGTVELTSGFNDIELGYYQGAGSSQLRLEWKRPGDNTLSVVPSSSFYHAVVNEYCDSQNLPKIFNFAVQFELENGETVKINLN